MTFLKDLAKKFSKDCQVLPLFFFDQMLAPVLAPVEKNGSSKSRTTMMPKKCRDLPKLIFKRKHTFLLKLGSLVGGGAGIATWDSTVASTGASIW